MGIGALVALALFVLVIFVLPAPLARYVIESQLEKLGIQHSGIETVDIDLWNRHVRAGPVSFHSGEKPEGQIGETGFDYSFGAIFKGRAFVQTFYLQGVDLYIARLQDGSIEINGINLQEIGRSEEEEVSAEQTPEGEEDSGFGFGVERFEFSDSQLVFEDVTGGALTMELQRLTLDRLLTWTPTEPTTFAFEGRLNEIQLSFDGTMVPLGDPLLFTFNSQVTGLTIDRLARFIGPTGLARQDGSVNTEVHYAYAFHRDGRIEGSVDGTYAFNDFEIATAEGATVRLGDALLKVDLQQELLPDGSASAEGQLSLVASPISVSSAEGDVLEVDSLALNFSDLGFNKGTETRRLLLDSTAAAIAVDEDSSKTPSIVQLMIGWAKGLGENALKHQLAISGHPDLALKGGKIRIAARGDAPAQEISFEKMQADLGEVQSQAFDAGVSATSVVETIITDLRLATEGGRAQAGLAEFQMNAGAIDFQATREETSLSFDLAVAMQELAASDDQGRSFDLSAVSLGSEGFSIKETAENEVATGPVTLSLEGLTANLPTPDGDLAVRGEALDLNLTPFSLAGKQGEATSFTGSLELRDLALERAGESPLSATLVSTRSDLQNFRIAPLNAQAAIEGNIATTLSGIRLEAGRDTEAASLTLESLENRVEGLQASGFDGGEPSVSLSNHTRLDRLAARLPLGSGQTADVAIASLEAPLRELALSGQALRASGDIEIADLSAATLGETPQSLDVASISVGGLSGDSETGAEIETLSLGELVAKLTLPLPGVPAESASGANPENGAVEASQTKSKDSGSSPQFDKQIKLGAFSVAPGSRIEITDRSVEPPLQANILLDKLRLGPLDTGAPATKTDLDVAVSINETAKVTVQGWASPFKPDPDFQLKSRIDKLSLPPLSPYAASVTGVNIESGALSADVAADAAEAKLAGKIDLRIDDLFVTPLSEEDAEKLEADIGLPVGFAVSILKDSEGVIEFGLPLSGTVTSPEVDYSEAISKAISGAMASVFPTSWFGPDGNSFEMQPALFLPATTELTEEGKAVADQMGELFAEKPGISIRACGRAARDDLIVLRGGIIEPTIDPDLPAASDAPATPDVSPSPETAGAATPAPQQSAPLEEIAKPNEEEVKQLLALAKERGTAVRKYLEAGYGIAPAQVPECRTAYSIKDGKPPRAEFQF